jgi:hypothetical protein
VNGFDASVAAADTFTILASNQPLSGEFLNVAPGTRLNTADGHGSFRVNYGATSAFGATTVVLSDFQRSAPAGFAAWAASFGLTGHQALPAADPDSDGITNLVEYAFALTPVLPGGFQYLPTLDRDTEGRAVITFSLPEQLPADVVCDVEGSADLLAWQILSSSSSGTWSGGGSTPPNGRNVVRITDTAAGTRHFLRVKVRLVD